MWKTLVAACFILTNVACAQVPEVAFRVQEKDLIPEGISWDPSTGNFYLGSIHKNKIVKINSTGEVTDFVKSNQDGLGQALGIHIDSKRSHLWVCSIEGENISGGKSYVHQYDLRSKRLIQKFQYSVEGEIHLFNDIIVTSSGEAYVTDSDFGAIFKIDPSRETLELFLDSDQLQYCNGITFSPDQSKLIVSTGKGIISIDIETKEISRINLGYLSIADGLYQYENSLIAVQNVFYPVSIVQFHLNETFDSMQSASLLAVDHPLFDIPTTGVVVEDWFYFIANSQMMQLENNVIMDPDKLKEVVILKIKLM